MGRQEATNSCLPTLVLSLHHANVSSMTVSSDTFHDGTTALTSRDVQIKDGSALHLVCSLCRRWQACKLASA